MELAEHTAQVYLRKDLSRTNRSIFFRSISNPFLQPYILWFLSIESRGIGRTLRRFDYEATYIVEILLFRVINDKLFRQLLEMLAKFITAKLYRQEIFTLMLNGNDIDVMKYLIENSTKTYYGILDAGIGEGQWRFGARANFLIEAGLSMEDVAEYGFTSAEMAIKGQLIDIIKEAHRHYLANPLKQSYKQRSFIDS